MSLTILPTLAPFGQVAVNPAEVAAIVPSPNAGDGDADLKLAGGRSVYVLLDPHAASDLLGGTFVPLERPTAGAPVVFFVNPDQVAEIVPTSDGVCAVVAGGMVMAAKGTFEEILAKF